MNRRTALLSASVAAVAALIAGGVIRAVNTPAAPPSIDQLGATSGMERVTDPALAKAIDAAVARVLDAPRDADLRADLAMLYDAHGYLAEADATYRQALTLRDEARLHALLADVLARRGDDADAIAQLRMAIALEPNHIPTRAALVRLLASENRIDDALAEATGATARGPVDPSAWIVTAEVLHAKSDYAGAQDAAARAVRLSAPRSPLAAHANWLLGQALASLGRGDEATIALARAKSAQPADGADDDAADPARLPNPWRDAVDAHAVAYDAVRVLAHRLVAEGEFFRAIPLLEDLRGRRADDSRVATDLGVAYRAIRRAGDAVTLLRAAVLRDAENGDLRIQLALALEDTGDIEASLREASAAIDADPTKPLPYEARGMINLRQGRYAEAVADFDGSLARDPTLARIHVHAGVALVELKELTAAQSRFQSAATLDPSEPDAIAGIALVLLRSGDRRNAVLTLRQSADLAPGGSLLQNIVRRELVATAPKPPERAPTNEEEE